MPLEMNPEIRAQWCAALRSGEYEQGHGKLCTSAGRCCLGVLTDLAVKAGVAMSVQRHEHGWMVYEGCSNWLPPAVQAWAGIPHSNPSVTADLDFGPERVTLAVLNDEYSKTFAEIADLIDGGTS